MLLIHSPGPSLASCIELLWYCEEYQAPHRRERVLPNGRVQLLIDLSDGFTRPGTLAAETQHFQRAFAPLVVGIQTQYSVIETAGLQKIMGVVFWPGGTRALFDVPTDEFSNQHVPLDLVWGSIATELCDRLREAPGPAEKFRVLETSLHRRVEQLELHAAVRFALHEFRGAPHVQSVVQVAKDAGLSRRRFAQLFREQVGLTPKLYCRLHRFREVVRQIASSTPVDWADVALAGGYCDQAHMANEFRGFSGLSPGAYLASERPSLNHVALE